MVLSFVRRRRSVGVKGFKPVVAVKRLPDMPALFAYLSRPDYFRSSDGCQQALQSCCL